MKKIIVSGFGGQGVLSLGLFMAYAAMNADRNVSWLPSYGPEMRGGTANVSVSISHKPIASPVISHPDVLVAMNAPSVGKFLDKVAVGGKVFVNSSVVGTIDREDVQKIFVPVDDIAAQINPRGANIVMLGAMLDSLSEYISYEQAAAAVEYVFRAKPQFRESNLRCLEAGKNYRG